MISKSRRHARDRVNLRRLRFETLESRQMLAGVVNIDLAFVPGALTLRGDASNNDVTLAYGPAAGSYVVTGNNGTVLQINGAGQTFNTPQTVNGIAGPITVDLGSGESNTFTFSGTTGTVFAFPSLTIVDATGVYTINNAQIAGNLTVSKTPALATSSTLTINNTTIVGLTTINNNNGGALGDSSVNITSGTGLSSQLQGGIVVNNGLGDNSFMVTGTTAFGSVGPAQQNPLAAPLANVVTINNNPAGDVNGTFISFGGTSNIYGSMVINTGTHLAGISSLVNFTGTKIGIGNSIQVLGRVTIDDAGGTSTVNVTNTSIGTHLLPAAPPNQALSGNPLVIQNNTRVPASLVRGAAGVNITGSTIQWGVFIDDNATAGFGSTTNITSSFIGTRPGGLTGLTVPAFAAAGDALTFVGENGNNRFNMTGTTVGGGIVNFNGPLFGNQIAGNNNSVTIGTSTLVGLNLTTQQFVGGNNVVTLNADTIQVSLNIQFRGGTNFLNTLGSTSTLILPDPLTGFIRVTGENGLDTWFNGAGVTIVGITGFVPGASVVVI
jgi:hypothetical protein